jgi:hypothetical protein
MASIITGSDCTLTIDDVDYSCTINAYTLSFDTSAAEYQTLCGPVAGKGTETGTLDVTAAFDAGETASLFDALWAAADTGANITYAAVLGTTTFTGQAVPARPDVNATAGEVSEFSSSMALNGIPTKTTA